MVAEGAQQTLVLHSLGCEPRSHDAFNALELPADSTDIEDNNQCCQLE